MGRGGDTRGESDEATESEGLRSHLSVPGARLGEEERPEEREEAGRRVVRGETPCRRAQRPE